MKVTLLSAALSLSLLASVPAYAADTKGDEAVAIEITRAGAQPSSKGPAANFVGAVRVDPLLAPHNPASRISIGSVTFESGARSAWHTHPAGQILIVTSGLGWVQQDGKPVEEIRPGNVVWIPPGVKHWHGASASVGMTHIAIQEVVDGRNVEWKEPVSAEQYHK